MRTLLLALFCCASAFGAVNCTNNSSTDPGLFNAAVAAGGTQVVNGPCSVPSTSITLNNAVTLTGGTNPTINGNNNAIFILSHDNVTLNGLILNAGYVDRNVPSGYLWNFFTFTNNTIQNLTNGGTINCNSSGSGNCVGPSGLNFSGIGLVSGNIQFNHFSNIWGNGYPTSPYLNGTPTHTPNLCYQGTPAAGNCLLDFWGAQGITIDAIDLTTIANNNFDMISNDGMHIDWLITTGNSGPARTTSGNVIAFNTYSRIHRIPQEVQSQPNSNCPGGCNFNIINTTGMYVEGSYAHDWVWPFLQSFGYSLVPDGTRGNFYINNTMVANLNNGDGNGMADCLEVSNNNGIVQGNVCAITPTIPSITGISYGGHSLPSFTITTQNNILCGNSGITQQQHEADPSQSATVTSQFNYTNSSFCPAGANPNTPGIVSAYTSANNQNFSPSTTQTYNFTVISNLSIKFVNFFLDGSPTAVATQMIQDQSTTFGTDRKWLYHATFNVGTTPGTHTLQAVATDVSGNTTGGIQNINYTINGTGGPVFSLSTSTLNFGTQTVLTTSTAQNVTVTNTGTTLLVFSSQIISGDFALLSNTCGSTLAAGASCSFGVTFTPTIAGARAGSVTFTDNAPGSPHVISLTGTGTNVTPPVGCPQNPPNFLSNCGFNSGLTNWSTASGNATITVLTGAYGPGGSSGVQITVNSISGPVLTGNIEIFQNTVAVAANTGYAYTVAIQATRMQGSNNLLIQNGGSFANYGLNNCQPTLAANSFTMVSCPFTTNANPTTLGPARFTIQLDGAQAGDVFQIANPTIVTSSATVVTNITFPTAYISHSVAQIKFNSANAFNALRIRYDTADCSGGATPSAAGGVIPMESGLFQQVGMVTTLGGLAANTKYFACPEVSSDNGTTWSIGASASLTTLPLPAIHPALPTTPITFDTSYPNTTGFATYSVASDCSDLMTTAYPAAVARQATQGTVISIPAGTTCNAANYKFNLQPPGVVSWSPGAVNTATGVITLGGTPTLTVGQQIQIGRSNAGTQTYPASTSCEFGSGFVDGQVYTLATVTTGNAATFLCPDKQTLMSFTSQGTVTSGTFLYSTSQLFPIIIRSAAADSALPPPKVLITPDYASQMAVFSNPVTNFGQSAVANGFITFLDPTNPNLQSMVSNIRFGPGIEFTVASSPESLTSSDPNAWFNEVVIPPAISNVIFDRVYWHYPGSPVRVMQGWQWNGVNVGSVNSWFDKAIYFRSAYSGLANAKTGSATFTVASGTHNVGRGPISVAARTVTISGSSSGVIYEGLDMQNSNAFTLWLPTGISASCSGGSCATSNAQFSGDGTCTNTGAWEKDGSGKVSVGIIACIPVNAGVVGTPTAANPLPSTSTQVASANQGTQFIVASQGPGPYIFSGNHIEGAGRLMNFSNNSGSTAYLRGNYTITQNHFVSPLSYMYGSATSDGLTYGMEEPLQIQAGRSVNISGNVFDGDWVENSPSSSFVRLSSINGIGITDVNMQNNTFRHGPGVSNIPSNDPTVAALPTPPSLRFQFSTNLAWDIGSSSYWVPSGGQTAPKGQMLSLGNGTEDAIIYGNTVLNNQGLAPVVIGGRDTQMEGLSVTYNIFNIDSIFKGAAQDPTVPATNACNGLTGSLYAACKFTPTYVWQNNLMIGNGLTPAQVLSAWPQFPSNPVVVF